MTIGQRIALKRKERNLSQEALGEELGVSRQSISKWESDASLPEIEKLVAMSRLFAVSVGWLLGVEETGAESAPDTGELSEAQLKMVEEIVARYIAAQPKGYTLPTWRRRTFKICIAIAGACLAMGLFWMGSQLERLDSQYNNLQNSMGRISDTVNTQINGIGRRVEEILQAQNNLTAAYDAQWVARDIAAGTVTITASAVPKTYREGMTALFVADCGGDVVEAPAQLGEGQTFSATWDCPLVDNIDVSVVFLHGETREIQLLQTFYDLYTSTVPPAAVEDTWLFHNAVWADGVLTINTVDTAVRKEWENLGNYFSGNAEIVQVAEIRLGIFKNRQLVAWAKEVPKPDSYRGTGWEDYLFFTWEQQTIPFAAGDILCAAAVVTDEYGRTTVRAGMDWTLNQVGGQGDAPPQDILASTTGEGHYYRYDDPAEWGL